jgi:hypothetical protein
VGYSRFAGVVVVGLAVLASFGATASEPPEEWLTPPAEDLATLLEGVGRIGPVTF